MNKIVPQINIFRVCKLVCIGFITLVFIGILLKPTQAQDTILYINGSYEDENTEINEVIKALRAAVPKDKITLYIRSYGGDAFQGIQIVNAILDSEAEVTTVADGLAASAGYATLIYGDVIKTSTYGHILAHLVRKRTSFTEICIPTLNSDLQYNFAYLLLRASDYIFTKEEILGLLYGEDIVWVNHEFQARLDERDSTTPGQNGTLSAKAAIILLNEIREKHAKIDMPCISPEMLHGPKDDPADDHKR